MHINKVLDEIEKLNTFLKSGNYVPYRFTTDFGWENYLEKVFPGFKYEIMRHVYIGSERNIRACNQSVVLDDKFFYSFLNPTCIYPVVIKDGFYFKISSETELHSDQNVYDFLIKNVDQILIDHWAFGRNNESFAVRYFHLYTLFDFYNLHTDVQ